MWLVSAFLLILQYSSGCVGILLQGSLWREVFLVLKVCVNVGISYIGRGVVYRCNWFDLWGVRDVVWLADYSTSLWLRIRLLSSCNPVEREGYCYSRSLLHLRGVLVCFGLVCCLSVYNRRVRVLLSSMVLEVSRRENLWERYNTQKARWNKSFCPYTPIDTTHINRKFCNHTMQ